MPAQGILLNVEKGSKSWHKILQKSKFDRYNAYVVVVVAVVDVDELTQITDIRSRNPPGNPFA
jgi:hypothetical protein